MKLLTLIKVVMVMNNIGWVWDERYLQHDTGSVQYSFQNGMTLQVCDEFENKNRMIVIKEMIEKSGLNQYMKAFSPLFASDDDLLRVHSMEHLYWIKEAGIKGIREIGLEAYGCRETEEVARLSAGGAVKAVDIVMNQSDLKQVYAQIRPPGHHATRDAAMGFCFYNNVAVAAAYAIERYKLKRVVVLDWDVHHGNGTQDIFYKRDDVLVISIHEEGYFPLNTGAIEEMGEGKGKGFNVNIPLPSLTGDEGYQIVFETVVSQIINQYQPELIFISAGQDPNALDPLSRMLVSRKGFKRMAEIMKELANTHCDGKMVVIQEGGYSLPYLPIATMGVLEGLIGVDIPWKDPHKIPYRELPNQFFEYIEKIKGVQKSYWSMSTT